MFLVDVRRNKCVMCDKAILENGGTLKSFLRLLQKSGNV